MLDAGGMGVEVPLILSEKRETQSVLRQGAHALLSFPGDTVIRPGSGGNRYMEKDLNTTGHGAPFLNSFLDCSPCPSTT